MWSSNNGKLGDEFRQDQHLHNFQQISTNQQNWAPDFAALPAPVIFNPLFPFAGFSPDPASFGFQADVFGIPSNSTTMASANPVPQSSGQRDMPVASSPSAELASKRLGLDARAAELKKKLLKGRAEKDRTASPAKDSIIASKTNIASKTRPPNFVPHTVPRKPTQTSVQADEEDIHELIRSLANDQEAPSGANDRKPAQSPLEEGEITGEDKGGPKEVESRRVSKGVNSSTTASISNDSASTKLTSTDMKKKVDGSVGETERIYPRGPRVLEGRNDSRQAHSAEAARESHAKPPGEHIRRPQTQKNDMSGERSGQVQPQKNGTSGEQNGWSQPEKTNTSSDPNKYTQPQNNDGRIGSREFTIGDELSRLMARDKDLRDWLILTDFYNVEGRHRKLERYRKQMQLDAEMKKLEAEKLKLQAEEAAEMGFRHPAADQTTSTPSTGLGADASNALPGVLPGPSKVVSDSAPITEHLEPKTIPAKREYDEQGESDSSGERREKMPRLDEPRGQMCSPSRETPYQETLRGRPSAPNRGPSPRRHSPPRYEDYRRSPPRTRDGYGYDSRERYGGYDSYRRDSFPARPRSRGAVDLGQRGGQSFLGHHLVYPRDYTPLSSNSVPLGSQKRRRPGVNSHPTDQLHGMCRA